MTTNYGGILQNYALQVVLKERGCLPVTVDYVSEISNYVKFASYSKRLLKRIFCSNIPLRAWVTEEEMGILAQHTRKFVEKNINTTKKIKLSKLSELDFSDFSGFIVGSDQVWRGNRPHLEKFYFSDFDKYNFPKIAYAASFGLDRWIYSKFETDVCSRLAKRITAVSVREDSGVFLCNKYLGVNSTLVLDPTLLIDRKYYIDIANQISNNNKESTRLLMVYVLDESLQKKQIVDNIASRFGLSTQVSDLDFMPFERML